MNSLRTFVHRYQLPLLTTVVICLALLLRIYQWQNYVFGFDQIQMIQRGKEILQGDQILIGPKTGGGDMYIGPLSYYFTAFFLLLAPMPYTLIFMANVWNLLTGVSLVVLSKDLLTKKQRLILLSLWALSPFIIELDRIPWNPSSLFFATTLIFFPMLRQLKKLPWRWLDSMFIIIGTVIATNSHFSGLMLPIVVTVILLANKRLTWRIFLSLLTGTVLGIAPLLIFDLRNNWLNTRGIIAFLFFSEKVDASGFSLILKIIDSLRITTENVGKVLFFPNHYLLNLFSGGIIIFLAGYYGLKQRQPLLLILVAWMAMIGVMYGFYSGAKPEYYYLIQFPATILLIGLLIDQMLSTKRSSAAIALLAVYTVSLAAYRYVPSTRLDIGNTWQVAEAAILLSEHTSIQSVTYDMQFVHSEGLRYLLQDRIKLVDQGQELHLIYPAGKKDFATQRFGEVVLWLDPRTNPEQTYLSTSTYILSTPTHLSLLLDRKVHPLYGNDLYMMFDQEQKIGVLSVIERYRDNDFFDAIDRQLNSSEAIEPFPNWREVIVNNEKYLLSKRGGVFLLAQFNTQLNLSGDQQQSYLDQIGIMLP